MRTIPTVEVFIINKTKYYPNGMSPTPNDFEEWMIEFAKIHVAEALKQASEKAEIENDCDNQKR